MDVPTCRYDYTDMSLDFYHGLVPVPPVVASEQLAAAVDRLPLVATASAHKWFRWEMRLSMACWTSVGLSGAVSRGGGSARTAGYAGDRADDVDVEQPDATTASARQIAKAASNLAATQLWPCIWAYPRAMRSGGFQSAVSRAVGASRSPYAGIMFTNRKTSTSSQRAGK